MVDSVHICNCIYLYEKGVRPMEDTTLEPLVSFNYAL